MVTHKNCSEDRFLASQAVKNAPAIEYQLHVKLLKENGKYLSYTQSFSNTISYVYNSVTFCLPFSVELEEGQKI